MNAFYIFKLNKDLKRNEAKHYKTTKHLWLSCRYVNQWLRSSTFVFQTKFRDKSMLLLVCNWKCNPHIKWITKYNALFHLSYVCLKLGSLQKRLLPLARNSKFGSWTLGYFLKAFLCVLIVFLYWILPTCSLVFKWYCSQRAVELCILYTEMKPRILLGSSI